MQQSKKQASKLFNLIINSSLHLRLHKSIKASIVKKFKIKPLTLETIHFIHYNSQVRYLPISEQMQTYRCNTEDYYGRQ